nr:cyclic nucleotide-binding domain-containing protein [Methylomarinum sp. Ch1-1]MDP4521984.1 cyclic nucleotide-binding domain-containing protein [Methylomarinum sp. Ch1-1]
MFFKYPDYELVQPLFSRASTPNKQQRGDARSAQGGAEKSLSQPLPGEREKQDLGRLKQFVPLRELEDSVVAGLPQSTLIFGEGALIFNRGDNTDHVYYLLEGRIAMQPDSVSCYEVSADSTRAHLPLNSGHVCGATARALTEVKILLISVELNRLWSKKVNKTSTVSNWSTSSCLKRSMTTVSSPVFARPIEKTTCSFPLCPTSPSS